MSNSRESSCISIPDLLEKHIQILEKRKKSMKRKMSKIRDEYPELAAGLSRGIARIDKVIAETRLVLDEWNMENGNERDSS